MLDRTISQNAKRKDPNKNTSVKSSDRAASKAFHAYVATGFVLVYMLAVTASTIAMAAVL